MFNRLHTWLLNRADRQADNVWIFTLGAVTFFFGMGIIVYAEKSLAPSLGQEIIVLFGFILAIIGGFAAIIGYLSLSLLRFLRFASRERIKAPSADPIEPEKKKL
jgi:uncharacterized membrane protein YcjF (UPF0283 family)